MISPKRPTILLTSMLLVLLCLISTVCSAPSCSTRRQQVNVESCKYGTYVDWCRNTVCAKGPGQSCGGDWWEFGKCGEGTYCACGTCSGCSLNLECWSGTFC
uniref:Neuroparsin III n=1 Tax=Macrobrachium nipponense TaxID=159736 RepID=A0A6M2RB70_MACNP|nr:neuroparsin III precursor [Macrobrachium nipponense]